MGFTLLDGIVCLSCVGLSYAIYAFSHLPSPPPGNDRTSPQAYILRSITSHARFLPVDSRHAFTYPVLSLLLPLSALESGQLSLLNGFLFSFGGIHGRILGMRSAGYLYDDSGKEPSIRKKLGEALEHFGIESAGEQMDDAWILTMPSYCGFEGINPLTVYFCYRKDGPELWIVVLEIHNTFGERHLHILEVGKNEEPPDSNFDHQWSFPRAFHVSPFNDRLGTYTVSVRAPFSHSHSGVVLPLIRVRLHNPSGTLKFSASLHARHVAPFTANTVLGALTTHPFILFLTIPRILYESAVLHYRRRLNVYKRPEPKPVRWTTAPPSTLTPTKGGGIGWQHPTLLERAARRIVTTFLARRADALGVVITLQPGDPLEQTQRFDVHHDEADGMTEGKTRELVISYLSPRFFTLLVLAGDAPTALQWGRGTADDVREFVASDEALFSEVFDAGTIAGGEGGATWPVRLLRLLPQPGFGGHEQGHEHEQHAHPLAPRDRVGQAGFAVLLCALVAIEWAEEMVWQVARVRWAVSESVHPTDLR